MEYEEIIRIPVDNGDRIRYEGCGSILIVERPIEPPSPPKPTWKWRDITRECITEMKKSKASSGYYVAIHHEGEQIFGLGLCENMTKVIVYRGKEYKIQPVADGRVSFKIFRKEKC